MGKTAEQFCAFKRKFHAKAFEKALESGRFKEIAEKMLVG
jgi:hypothetical protein